MDGNDTFSVITSGVGMASFWTWAVAAAFYAVFLAWHLNWRGRLSSAEIRAILAKLEAQGAGEKGRNALSTLQDFLEADDGRAFYMLNVVRLASGPVKDPTGREASAQKVMAGYTRMFLPALLARGGYPAFAARKVGGYFDTWGLEPGPDWSFIALMRYRSRRDLAALVCDPRFSDAHDFKFAAMPQTFNFPTQRLIGMMVQPTVWVALSLALAAAIGQIIWLTVLVGTGA